MITIPAVRDGCAGIDVGKRLSKSNQETSPWQRYPVTAGVIAPSGEKDPATIRPDGPYKQDFRGKANAAVGHSLLKVVWCVLRTGNPYREPDAGVMHEMERQKLAHHHARRLRALGAKPDEQPGLHGGGNPEQCCNWGSLCGRRSPGRRHS